MKEAGPDARNDFIRRHTRLLPVPHAPEISLYLADEATALWEKTEEELDAIGLPPPFWAFAWAGGQALARYVLDHPEIVRGRCVLDFASGSGLVAIAAARAGAAYVEAVDIDAFAVTAIRLNADANDVSVTAVERDIVGNPCRWDVVLAGDIAYQEDMAERCFAWLDGLSRTGATVLVGDPGRSYLPRGKVVPVATFDVPVTRSLEDNDIKRTSVWRFVIR